MIKNYLDRAENELVLSASIKRLSDDGEAENPEKYRKNRTLQRKRNPEGFKIIDRIRYLRKEQKKLAIQSSINNEPEGLNNSKIQADV